MRATARSGPAAAADRGRASASSAVARRGRALMRASGGKDRGIVRQPRRPRPSAAPLGSRGAPARIIPYMSSNPRHDHEHGTLVDTGRPEVAPPPMDQVILVDDDYTPLNLGVAVVQEFSGVDLGGGPQ